MSTMLHTPPVEAPPTSYLTESEAERPEPLELSVVLPCLNEADCLATCITKAQRAMRSRNIQGEIIVADNGSTDGSQEIAIRLGARLVRVPGRGYGNALMAGIAAARGRFIIMGDSDDSYDFLEIPKFVDKLREGSDLVQGCRLHSGGGRVEPGAMPLLHRWIGNPLFSFLARLMFDTQIRDIYCGLRGFRKELFAQLDQRCTGMEFATEMIIKASLHKARIAEIPIILHPDGRKSHKPHLKTFRDGWRTVRFFLISSPKWLFFVPGLALVLLGLLGYGVAMPGLTVLGATFDAHTLLFASLAMLLGYQAMLFAVFAKTFAISEGLLPQDAVMTRLFEIVNLERGLIVALCQLLLGLGLLLAAVNDWRLAGFGRLDYAYTMRIVIPGATLTAIGFQTVLSSFVISILGMQRRRGFYPLGRARAEAISA
jgi:glycosyltransferase involved in cell wall biosynthesis